MTLKKQSRGYNKHNEYMTYSLWEEPEGADFVGGTLPESWTITCTVDGVEGASQHWNGWDFQLHYDKDNAIDEFNWYSNQLHNSPVSATEM
tara:strand:+ start:287 stop:559 length:273 start_codon:yes stop_codon:yes gene_type:complete